ncbi:MAG: 3-methyl-2-oxobutanoate dehydrogenase subunit VorB [Chloroflexota bacterium]
MVEKLFVQGNEAIGWGALMAGCEAFFGYPITPQNEVIEWFSREYPRRGLVFLQSQSETASVNMLYGAASTGIRALTSTSSPGWALMQETMSHAVNAELPFVVVVVQRGGIGQGTTQHAQMDYTTATRGGGQGGYRVPVVAPASVQETHDFVQLAFYLADKYRTPAIVLTDGLLGQMMEGLEVKCLDFGPLPEKDWALRGRAYHPDGKRRAHICESGLVPLELHVLRTYLDYIAHWEAKFREMERNEVRYESYLLEDAELVLVAYGYVARVCLDAMDEARSAGLKVGLVRPITVWPFPKQVIREQAERGARFLVAEDSLGQMVEDVRLAVEGRSEVYLLSMLSRHVKSPSGMILSDSVLNEIHRLLEKVGGRR